LIVEFCPEIISSLFVCITLPQTCMVSQLHRSSRGTKFRNVGAPQYNTCNVSGNSGLRPFQVVITLPVGLRTRQNCYTNIQ
jgi:hypothetical protein